MQFILFLNKAFHWHVFLSFMYATFRLCQYTFKTDMKLNELMKRNRDDISRSLETIKHGMKLSENALDIIFAIIFIGTMFVNSVCTFRYVPYVIGKFLSLFNKNQKTDDE